MAHVMNFTEWCCRNPDAERQICQQCAGDGHVECHWCKGAGSLCCPDHSGKGCEVCQGTGYVFCECEDGKARCDECDGWGHMAWKMYEAQRQRETTLIPLWIPTLCHDSDTPA